MKASLKGPGLLMAICTIASFVSGVAVFDNSHFFKASVLIGTVSLESNHPIGWPVSHDRGEVNEVGSLGNHQQYNKIIGKLYGLNNDLWPDTLFALRSCA
jgi:hypothetical protein